MHRSSRQFFSGYKGGERIVNGWGNDRCKKGSLLDGASLKDAGRLTFAAARMGAEVIPGLLESIRKATSERREYGKGEVNGA